ncbi:MAG: T9SS type A sorting domain-containing protein [Bacteroidia bacterium]
MKKLALLFLTVILLFFNAKNSSASHIYGADIEWQLLAKDSLLVTVTVFRDCNGTPLSLTSINVYNGLDSLSYKPKIDSSTIEDVTPICANVDTRCGKQGGTFKYGIEKYVLTAVVNIDSLKKQGWCETYISWQQCCRSNTITTGQANQGFYVNASLNLCNLVQVKWNHSPKILFSLGQSTTEYFDVSINEDVDSIKYHFVPALGAKDSITKYDSNYSYKKPISYLGFPRDSMALPRGIHLDSNYGHLNFRPMRNEIAVAAVEATVYKSGKLIASTKRDIQFIVLKNFYSKNPLLSDFDGEFPSTNKEYSNRYKRLICGNRKFCFDIASSATYKNDSTFIEVIVAPSNSTFNLIDSNARLKEGTFCWDPRSQKANTTSTLALRVRDNACPVYNRNTFYYEMTLIDSLKVKPKMEINALNDCGDFEFKVTEKSNLPFQWVKWYVNDTILISENDSFKYRFDSIGKYPIKLVVDDCRELVFRDTLTVKTANKLSINFNDTKVCPNTDFELKPIISGNNGSYKLQWQLGSSIELVTTLNSNILKFDNSLITKSISDSIWLTATDSLGCIADTGYTLLIRKFIENDFQSNDSLCSNDYDYYLSNYANDGKWKGPGIYNDRIIDIDQMAWGNNHYTFYMQNKDVCVIDSAVIKLKKSPRVKVGRDFSACTSSDTMVLKGNPSGGRWSGSGISQSGIFNPAALKVGTYRLSYYVDSANCTSRDRVYVTVLDYKPEVSVTEKIEVCNNGDSVKFEASVSGGFWKLEGVQHNVNPLIVSPIDYEPSTMKPSYTFIDSIGCQTVEKSSFIVNRIFKPSFTLISDSLRINDTLVAINTSNYGAKVEFMWEYDSPLNLTSNSDSFKSVLDTSGVFNLKLVSTHNKTLCSDTTSKKIVVGYPVGLSKKQEDIQIYPNPANHVLNIKSKYSINTKIFTIHGVELIHSNKNQIDISMLPSGIYMILVDYGSGVYKQHLIKR